MITSPTKNFPIPVRLDAETRARTKNAATRLGVSASGIIRLSLMTALDGIEAGRITLPNARP